VPTRTPPHRPYIPSALRNEKNPLKLEGLAFGQAFQTLFKMSMMYSVDHPAASRSMQQSLDRLLPFLKEGQPFTIGFMNDRLLLNRTLVTQTNLTHLQVELAKRQIAAITFQPGVTLKEFQRAVAVLTLRPALIAERGGIANYLAANPIEGIRIIPAAKPRGDDEMLDVGTDIESYLAGQSRHRPESVSTATGLETLRAAARAKDPNRFGGTPREVLNLADEATRHVLADPEGSALGALRAVSKLACILA